MAVRFIDFGYQLDPSGPRRFGFWDDDPRWHREGRTRGKFLTFGHYEDPTSWASWDELRAQIQRASSTNIDIHIEELKALCVFGQAPAEPATSPPSLDQLLIFCDCLSQDMGFPAEAEALRELVEMEQERKNRVVKKYVQRLD